MVCMLIFYGFSDDLMDVTRICLTELLHNNVITIPSKDENRTRYFSDPLPGIKKNIIISLNGTIREYDETMLIKINIRDNTINAVLDEGYIYDKIQNSCDTLKIHYGVSNALMDVTDICYSSLLHGNVITIPSGDENRSRYFSDPLVGIKKKIIIPLNGMLHEYEEEVSIKINITDNTINAVLDEGYIYDKIKNRCDTITIQYGIPDNLIDVTDICYSSLIHSNIIIIPSGDENRTRYFPNHLPGIKKKIIISLNEVLLEYDEHILISINTINNQINAVSYEIDNYEQYIYNKIKNRYSSLTIFYGIPGNLTDVTDICLLKLSSKNIIIIPSGDGNRAFYFSDPLPGIEKKIIISLNGVSRQYDETVLIKINTLDNTIDTLDERYACDKIKRIHSTLNINHGSLDDEFIEQKMAALFLKGHEKVLEIGGNIGRNSLFIASILDNDINLVTLECDTDISNQLKENRDLNNFNFNIENSALSNRKLIQRGWDTKPSDTLEEGYNWVNTITLTELKNKYKIEFDTLVLDCEGAFYYILMDMPEILNNINLIIMENDYLDISHKYYIDNILSINNYNLEYRERGGWDPCYHKFFEVWKKSGI